MTVQELITELDKIEDKTQQVYFEYFGYDEDYDDYYEQKVVGISQHPANHSSPESTSYIPERVVLS